MPRELEADLARRDAGLPGLATLFEPDAMARELAEVDPSFAAGTASLDLRYLRYKPGTNCIASYQIGEGPGARLFYAKAYAGDAQAKLEKAEAKTPRKNGLKRIRIDRLGLVIFEFPDDAELHALKRLAQPELRQRLLARALGDESIGVGDELLTLAYKPERRYVARLVRASDGQEIVFKFYGRERYLASRQAHRALGSLPDDILLQKRLGGSKSYDMLAFQWLSGPTLREALNAGSAVSMEEVGMAVARLHAQNSPQVAPPADQAIGEELDALAQTLSFLLPQLADDAQRIAEAIPKADTGAKEAPGLVHGDLYDKQIVLSEDRVGLIDLDDARMGDPRRDLGLFIAHLERDRIMGRDLGPLEPLVGAFLEGYGQARARPLEGLTPFIAEGLFRLAHHPFRRQTADWPNQTARILERTREILSTSAPT